MEIGENGNRGHQSPAPQTLKLLKGNESAIILLLQVMAKTVLDPKLKNNLSSNVSQNMFFKI